MSEYQCYEFLAIDRPLSQKEMASLRAVSTRAEITPTRFWNEYQWGELNADPAKLVARHFDAHLYFANWGSRRLMLRLPKARVDLKTLKAYFPSKHMARFAQAGEHLLLDLNSDDEGGQYDEESQGSLSVLAPLRAELLRGDLRAAYLAWLLAVQWGEVGDDATEPPVPSGLTELTAAQEAMVELLRIDVDLLAAAAASSAAAGDDRGPLLRWVVAMSSREKDAWLKRAIEEPELALGAELTVAFRSKKKDERVRRSVAALREQAEVQRVAREQREAARSQRAKVAADAARARHLSALARDLAGAWKKLTKLVENSKYDQAMTLAVALHDLAVRDGDQAAFEVQFAALRKSQIRRRGFFDRWKYRAK